MNATNPHNIYVGICIQNDVGDEDCKLTDPKLLPYEKNINTVRMRNYEAKGPTWARYLCTTLFNDEDYFLQIDSHTLFEKGWDVTCINMMNEIKQNTSSKDVVLSHYPPNYESYKDANKNLNVVDTICQSFFNERGMVSFLGATPIDMTVNKYVQTPHIAAGMFFCEGKCIREVPYDPNLPNLFVGEEILHSARVWTSGYDIYSPTQVVVYHLYTRADQPHIWDDNKNYNDTDAVNKVKMILDMANAAQSSIVPEYLKENIDKYGLGKKRTIQQFYDFAGIDNVNKKIYKNFCPKPHTIVPTKESFANEDEEKEGYTNEYEEKEGYEEEEKEGFEEEEKEGFEEDEEKEGFEEEEKEGFTNEEEEKEGYEEEEEHFTNLDLAYKTDSNKKNNNKMSIDTYTYINIFYFLLIIMFIILIMYLINEYDFFDKIRVFYRKNFGASRSS